LRVGVAGLLRHHRPAAFQLFTLVDPYPDVAYLATPAGAIYVEAPGVGRIVAAYDRLHHAALSATESTELIAAAAKELS
jgi:hypothetical protein